MSQQLSQHLAELVEVAKRMEALLPLVEEVAQAMVQTLANGGRVYAFGNGGSSSEAAHLTAELVGRYRVDRPPLAAVALTADSAALTCISNDFSFADVFSRQVMGLVRQGDMVIGLTTSGNSENVVRGLLAARECGALTVAMTGGSGGKVVEAADQALVVPTASTARIQEMHLMMIHMICELVDDWAMEVHGKGA